MLECNQFLDHMETGKTLPHGNREYTFFYSEIRFLKFWYEKNIRRKVKRKMTNSKYTLATLIQIKSQYQ